MRRLKVSKSLLIVESVLIVVFAANFVFGQKNSTTAACKTLPTQPVERELMAGKTDCYQIDLPKDFFFRARVEQKGVDVALKLLDPKGKTIAEVDSPDGNYGQEVLSVITLEPGVYKLEIKATTACKAAKGKYVVSQEAARTATENDRRQVEAQKIFDQAQNASIAAPQEALPQFEKAADVFREGGDKIGEGKSFIEIGYLFLRFRNKDSALSFYDKALNLFRNASDQIEEGKTLTSIGAVHFAEADYRESLKYFLQADALLKDTSPIEKADAQQGIAKSYVRLGELEKAIEYFAKAERGFGAVCYLREEAQTISNIGYVYLEAAQKRKALEYFNRALTIAQQNGFLEDEAAYYNNIGRAHDDLGEIEAAKTNFKLAESKTEDKKARAYIKLSIGKADFDLGNVQESIKQFEESRKMLQEENDRFGEVSAILLVGRAYSKLGDKQKEFKQKALEYYNLALRLYRNFGSKRGEATAFSNLMSVWNSLGNRRLAIFFGKQSINVYQQIRASARRIDEESQRSYIASIDGTYRTLAALLLEESRIEEGRISEAQEVLGLLKQEEFNRFTQSQENQQSNAVRQISLNDEEAEAAREYKVFEDEFTRLTQQLLALRREQAALQQQGQTLPPDKQAEAQKLQNELKDLNQRFDVFLKNLTGRFSPPKTENKLEPANTLTQIWQKKLTELDSGTVLLTTLLLEDRYYIIITTADSQIVRGREIRRAQLSDEIDRLRKVLRDPRTQMLRDVLPTAQELYRELLQMVAADLQRLNVKTLLLSLDGELRYVPFAALHDGQNFLVEKYANVVVTLAQPPDGRRTIPETWRALGAGISKKIGAEEPLPQVPDELQAIVDDGTVKSGNKKGIFPGEILLDANFTRSKLINPLKRKPQLVHLATHFKLGLGNPIDSYLLLGDGDQLKLTEMRNEKNDEFNLSNVDLLTLSACDTGAKEENDTNGVEIENLGVIAQKRGAKTVVASLWYVVDNKTPELMAEFYRRYKDGKGYVSKAETLRQAQAFILEKGKTSPNNKYTHPAYWGAFIVLGNL